jgi:Leucine-rich repeat (LRR) protein
VKRHDIDATKTSARRDKLWPIVVLAFAMVAFAIIATVSGGDEKDSDTESPNQSSTTTLSAISESRTPTQHTQSAIQTRSPSVREAGAQNPTASLTSVHVQEPSFDQLKSSSTRISYDDLFRNNERHVGKLVYFTGEIVQVVEADEGGFLGSILEAFSDSDRKDEPRFQLRVNVTQNAQKYWEDTMFLIYDGKRLLEGDIIEFVGTVIPLVTYESIFGQRITIPGVSVRQARLFQSSSPVELQSPSVMTQAPSESGERASPTLAPTPTLIPTDSAVTTTPTRPTAIASSPSPTPAVTTSDRDALIALYYTAGGESWTDNGGWLSDAPLGEWHGVTADDDGHVVKLDLRQNQLEGEIPAELGSLTNLEVLWLQNNYLQGKIPTELGDLSNLQVLGLYSNQLQGKIPSVLGRLINLQWLGLYGNELQGNIPPELGDLVRLEGLGLHSNQLQGQIPTELGALTQLHILTLQDNQLQGKIPVELGNLVKLEALGLDNNQLRGTIPAELGRLNILERLTLHNNQLQGEIPAELGNLVSLSLVSLSGNQFSGCIPHRLRDVTDNDLNSLRLLFCRS